MFEKVKALLIDELNVDVEKIIHSYTAWGMTVRKQGKCSFGQIHIGFRFQLSGNGQGAIIHQHVGKHQAGDKLAGNTAVHAIIAAFQFSLATNGILRGSLQDTAHTLHFLPQRRKRTLGKPAFHSKCGIHAQCTHHRQQKAKC